jgi:uncharacterized protein YndB with AHSA1/START domain
MIEAADDAIVLEIEIAGSPERVFRAITDPAQLAAWWNPSDGRPTTSWQLDLRVGGAWRASGWDEGCGHWVVEGEIVELTPPTALAYTWRERTERERPFGQTLVRYDLEPTALGTRLRLTHSGFGTHRDALDSHRDGWASLAEQLRHFVEPQIAPATVNG